MDESEIADLVDDLKSAGFPCIIVLGDNDQDDEIEESDDDEDDDDEE